MESGCGRIMINVGQGCEIHQIDYADVSPGPGSGRETPQVTPRLTPKATPKATPKVTPQVPSPIPNPSQSTGTDNYPLADVDDWVVFRPSESSEDEYSANLDVKNRSRNGETLIVKIKTTSPKRYRVRPIIFILSPNARARVNITTYPGTSAAVMIKDKFQAMVAIVPENMLPVSGSESDNSRNINANDVGSNFNQILSNATGFETYRVNVAVEAETGDTGPLPKAGPSTTTASSDQMLRCGLDDLERRLTANITRIEGMFLAVSVFAVIACALAILLLAIFIYLHATGGQSSKCCGAGITSVTGWTGDGTCGKGI